jgi:hypothetical protein
LVRGNVYYMKKTNKLVELILMKLLKLKCLKPLREDRTS